MKSHAPRFSLLPVVLLLVAAGIIMPSKGSAPEVALVGMALANRGHNPAPVFHVFGGQTVAAHCKLEAVATAEIAPAMLEARLFTIVNGLRAPLGPAVGLGELSFDGGPFQSFTVALPIPNVARRTEVDVQFQTRNATKTQPIGNARFFVYPEDLAAPLRGWRSKAGETAGLALGVFGKSQALRAYLKENKVAFEDLGGGIPSPSVRAMLLVGDATPAELEDWERRLPPDAEVWLVVFTQDPWRLPGVYTQTANRLHMTKVTLPVLSQLASDPLHQTSLVEILTQPLSITRLTLPNDP